MDRTISLSVGGELRIRRPTIADAEGLAELDRALAEDGRGMVLTPDQVPDRTEQRKRIEAAGLLDPDDWLGLIADLGGVVVGSATLQRMGPALCRHVGLLTLGVHPGAQRRGIGRALMQALLDWAEPRGFERLELYVRADNDRARPLYRQLGFEDEGIRRRFVRLANGRYVDDVIMVRFS